MGPISGSSVGWDIEDLGSRCRNYSGRRRLVGKDQSACASVDPFAHEERSRPPQAASFTSPRGLSKVDPRPFARSRTRCSDGRSPVTVSGPQKCTCRGVNNERSHHDERHDRRTSCRTRCPQASLAPGSWLAKCTDNNILMLVKLAFSAAYPLPFPEYTPNVHAVSVFDTLCAEAEDIADSSCLNRSRPRLLRTSALWRRCVSDRMRVWTIASLNRPF